MELALVPQNGASPCRSDVAEDPRLFGQDIDFPTEFRPSFFHNILVHWIAPFLLAEPHHVQQVRYFEDLHARSEMHLLHVLSHAQNLNPHSRVLSG